MATKKPDAPLLAKRKNHKWAKLIVVTLLFVNRMVTVARFIDNLIQSVRE